MLPPPSQIEEQKATQRVTVTSYLLELYNDKLVDLYKNLSKAAPGGWGGGGLLIFYYFEEIWIADTAKTK